MKKSVIKVRIAAIFVAFTVTFTMMPAAAGTLGSSAASPYWKSIKAKAVTENTIKLSWKALTINQQKKISGIAVFRDGKVVKKLSKKAKSYRNSGLKVGKTYKYQLKTYKKTTKRVRVYWNKKTGKWQIKKINGAKSKITKKIICKYSNNSQIVKARTKKPDGSGTIGVPQNGKAVLEGVEKDSDGKYTMGRVKLSWDAVDGAEFYLVDVDSGERKDSYRTEKTFLLDLGKTHTFKIAAVKDFKEGWGWTESPKKEIVKIKLPGVKEEEPVPYTIFLEETNNGLMRVSSHDNGVWIEYFDSDFNIISKKSIDAELPIVAGFYKGKDAYYLVEGTYNTDCINGTEVIRIIKYDFGWNRLGSGSIISRDDNEWPMNDSAIRYPFNYTSSGVKMTEVNDKLYVITSHEGYVDESVGQGHQGMLLMSMDESTYETKMVDSDLNHSFAQYIASKGSDIYTYELSEGNYCTQLSHYYLMASGRERRKERFSVLKYGGERTSPAAVPTYSTVNGLELSADNILGLGSSIDQSKYDNGDNEPKNLYLTVTPFTDLSSEATELIWLTDYQDAEKVLYKLALTKVHNNRFLITWFVADSYDDEFWELHYVFIDGSGNRISEEFSRKVRKPESYPVIDGDRAVFTSYVDGFLIRCSIDMETGKLSETVYPEWGNAIIN